jgi:hypothetical protein
VWGEAVIAGDTSTGVLAARGGVPLTTAGQIITCAFDATPEPEAVWVSALAGRYFLELGPSRHDQFPTSSK